MRPEFSIRLSRWFLVAGLLISGLSCGQSPETSLTTNGTVSSGSQSDMAGKTRFLRRYFKPTRTFEKLEYEISYQDNSSGRLPAPSDWDIRILAKVPEAELSTWIPGGATMRDQKTPEWVNTIGGSRIATDGVNEWHVKGGTLVGLDRKNNVVAYRNTTSGLTN